MVAMVATALNGMRSSNDDLTHIYYEGLLPADQVTRMLNEMHHARSQLLLALQHMPGSPFEHAHNHEVSMHLDAVDQAVRNIESLVQTLLAGTMDAQDRVQAQEMQRSVGLYHSQGVRPGLQAQREGEYLQASDILLGRLQPTLSLASDTVHAYPNSLRAHAVIAC